MVSGKDINAAVEHPPGPLPMLAPPTRRAGGLPPPPSNAVSRNAGAGSSGTSPATGVGVLAPPGGQLQPSPELVPVATGASGTNSVSFGGTTPKPRGTSKVAAGATPVHHPPMRTGTSSVSSTKKATIGATARKTGLQAVKEHQKELLRSMKVSSNCSGRSLCHVCAACFKTSRLSASAHHCHTM